MKFVGFYHRKIFYFGLAGIILCVWAGFFTYQQTTPPKGDIKEQTFTVLNKVRAEKKQEVVEYFAGITSLAGSITNDPAMLKYFLAMKQGNHTPDLEYEIDKHYVITYGNFYDILFVDSNGFVFHSIKKEADYHKNLFKSDFGHQGLAKILKNSANQKFSDFDYYRPSDEAAAFFPVPVIIDNQDLGWFILQCDINKVNAIFSDRKGLGRTGEIYLVNKERLMLSDSRFMEDSSILRQKVETLAVKEAFQQKTGNKIIKDYRGVKVFSSYESFNIFGASWVIIAEIDENEVITEHYKKHKKYFQSQFVKYLVSQSISSNDRIRPTGDKRKRVDINEYAKAEPGTVLTTQGVATCTAVAITYPEKFAYLAHISPTDEIYLKNPFTKVFLRENYHNFVSELLEQIKFYEVYPYELSRLQFVIVAPHSKSFAKAIDSFLLHGIELANIKYIYNPNSSSANVILNVHNNMWVQWNGEESSYTINTSNVDDLGEVLKKIIRYDI